MSGSASKRFAKDTDIAVVSARASMTVEDPFYAWGRFLKSITITESVSDRIEYFNVFHVKFAERWDFSECARLMRSLLAAAENKLYQAMCEVLEGEGGQHPVSEMQVRRGLRELFLEHRYPDVRDSSFWMSAVLRTQFSASKQVKLMYILFGPTKINDLLEAYPEPWLFDNFVALLLNRPALIPIAFVFRVVHGYHEEAGEMFSVMKSVLKECKTGQKFGVYGVLLF
ncbi:hypothetical protein Tcan_06652 [Toxocara canis]|uniref:FBXO47 ARM repeats region domain-containing protein n=1 Tax=Toxocara canis TaxID=6265 RepID=A0A0B2V8K1_TOXCA|nr:hypothetical protein Tcan_06652 [Toxocara canis]